MSKKILGLYIKIIKYVKNTLEICIEYRPLSFIYTIKNKRMRFLVAKEKKISSQFKQREGRRKERTGDDLVALKLCQLLSSYSCFSSEGAV